MRVLVCVRVCGERASFQALLALPLSLLVSRRLPACVCLAVLESVLFFGAQKAQHTLKDTWLALPAATLTSTANENKIVCMCVEDSLSGLKQRCAALRCKLRAATAAANAGCSGGTAVFCCQCVAMHGRTSAVRTNSCCCRVRRRRSAAHMHMHICACVCVFKNT